MTSFVLHPEALADVEEIGDYIAADNPRAAAHLIDEFYERFHSLECRPDKGINAPILLRGLCSLLWSGNIWLRTRPTRNRSSLSE